MSNLTEPQVETVLSISQLMVLLTQMGGNYKHQRFLNLESAKDYLEQGANHLAKMWVEGRINHDDYHTLMSHYRCSWDIINKILDEDFEVKERWELKYVKK